MYGEYGILFLAFHGDPEVLYLPGEKGKREELSLSELGDLLEGKCKGKVIYFGSCGTLYTHLTKLKSFLRKTSALAICGYKEDIDWMQSSAFEILLLDAFQKRAFTRQGMELVLRDIKDISPKLVKTLQFKFIFDR